MNPCSFSLQPKSARGGVGRVGRWSIPAASLPPEAAVSADSHCFTSPSRFFQKPGRGPGPHPCAPTFLEQLESLENPTYPK